MTLLQNLIFTLMQHESEELRLCCLTATIKLMQEQPWVEYFTLLNKQYRIETDPIKKEVRITLYDGLSNPH